MQAGLQYEPVALYRMINGIQEYAWGSRREIPRLAGIPNPDGKPMAELWMGDHPGMPSRLVSDGREIELGDFLSQHPNDALGPEVHKRFGGRLPYLFKLLSAERGLSIQVHPSIDQANEGYEREDERGVPRDAANRNYKDRNHKPEILHALTGFWALSGFRRPQEIAADFGQIDGAEELLKHLEAGNLEGFYDGLRGPEHP
jgi:mannose-6-phosphate isomerase